jgi:phosphoglycolate phosphatase
LVTTLETSLSIPLFPVYLFDVDGTLVDSAADICGAVQCVLAAAGRTDIQEDFLRGYIGRHLLDLFEHLFPKYTPEQIENLIVEYRRVYPARNHSMTHLYPGVVEGLDLLPGRKSTATTKGTPTTRTVLEKFGLLSYFNHVQGTDGFPAKPNPDVIYAALDALGASTADCLFVGDSSADMEAAKRAGVKSCAVSYGYGTREALDIWEPDYWISDLRQLAALAPQRGDMADGTHQLTTGMKQ